MIAKHNVFMAILATWIMILFIWSVAGIFACYFMNNGSGVHKYTIMLCINIVSWGIVICNILRG